MTESEAQASLEKKRKAELVMADTIRKYLKVTPETPINSDLFYHMSNEVYLIYTK
jgi:hypothetical protein